MDSEFQRLVDAAAEVAATGRWDAVNERIKNLAASPGPDSAWHVQLLGCLCSRLFSEYLLLKRAYGDESERDSSLLAWPARNLLELTVWSLYCGKDRANARRLYEDAGRDVLGIYSAFEKWGQRRPRRPSLSSCFRARSRKVNEAAEEVGIGQHFRLSYKMLSKFAHLTAMRILAPPDEERNKLQRDRFFSQGCLYFRGAFDSLESQLAGAA